MDNYKNKISFDKPPKEDLEGFTTEQDSIHYKQAIWQQELTQYRNQYIGVPEPNIVSKVQVVSANLKRNLETT